MHTTDGPPKSAANDDGLAGKAVHVKPKAATSRVVPNVVSTRAIPPDIIVFGEDWGFHPSSTQHLIRRLAKDRRVVWVNSIGLRRPRMAISDLRRIFRKLRFSLARAPNSAERVPPPFPCVDPLAIPMAEGMLGRLANRLLIGNKVRRAAKATGLRRPVLWASLPSVAPILGALGERAVVYYCCDDFGALAGVDHEAALRMEQEVARKADLIFVSSPLLAPRFPTAKTHLLPHGVDFTLFATPVPRAADLPDDGPTAGFYGTLAPWLDYTLIAEVARQLPHWRFVFLGHEAADVSAIRGLENVRILGARPHEALPGYAQHWTAGFIPFLDNEQIRASNPLKLREYLASGRPVVATPFPALEPYATLVVQAATPETFIRALQATLSDTQEASERRRASVAGESWDARAAEAASLIAALP